MFVNKKIIERIRKRAQTGNFEPIVSERSTRNKNEKKGKYFQQRKQRGKEHQMKNRVTNIYSKHHLELMV